MPQPDKDLNTLISDSPITNNIPLDQKHVSLIEVGCPRCGIFIEECLVRTPDFDHPTDLEFEVRHCTQCDILFTATRPPAPLLFSRFYPDDYVCFGTTNGSPLTQWMNTKRIRAQAAQRGILLTTKLPKRQETQLLEVGCATGEFLHYCHDHLGYQVCGVEPNQALASSLQQKGFTVFPTTLEESNLADDYYDVVCLFHVLEHVWNPVASLRRIHQALKAGGMLYIEMPNTNTPSRTWFGRYWFPYHLPRHLTHFHESSLRALLEELGFEWITVRYEFRPTIHAFSLQYWASSRFPGKWWTQFVTSKNPLVIGVGILVELVANLTGKTNTMSVFARKNHS